jgi:hypothetical protein
LWLASSPLRVTSVKLSAFGSRPCAQGAQAMPHGQRDSHARGPAAGRDETQGGLALAGAPDDLLPACRQAVDRLHGRCMLRCAGHRAQMRRGPDIEGEQVVGHGRLAAADDAPACKVDNDRLVVNETRPGKSRQRREVDVTFLARIVSGDEARQHAGVGRYRCRA